MFYIVHHYLSLSYESYFQFINIHFKIFIMYKSILYYVQKGLFPVYRCVCFVTILTNLCIKFMSIFHRDKLYSINNIRNNQRWGSPFVDIFWYDVNGTKVSARSYSTMTWKQILPLSFRPLGKRTVPAPYDPVDYLNRMYGSNWRKDCSSGAYDYLHERVKPKEFRVTIKCAALLNTFPFVRHIQGPADLYCKEELVFKERVLSTYVRSAKNIPVC